MAQLRSQPAAFFLAALVSVAHAQEQRPFHVSQYRDGSFISLAVEFAKSSTDEQFEFDVQVGLTEHNPRGEILFTDHGVHPAKIRCEAPGAIMSRGSTFIVGNSPKPGGWKEDLWLTFCHAPIS